MIERNRRRFLADVGRGMLLASLGPAVASELGVGPARAAFGDSERLEFGKLEPLVGLMQDTPAAKLTPVLVERLRQGTSLQTLVAAAGLANARTFGGQDYIGYHSFMALAPAYAMSQELPEERRALPVLKVIYRNTARMQDTGGSKNEVLHVAHADTNGQTSDLDLRAAERDGDMSRAEGIFAAMAKGPAGEAFNHLQMCVEDEVDVHRVVLSWRSWAMLDLVGAEHAHTLLRQSLRYCVHTEGTWIKPRKNPPAIRATLPRLLEQYRLVGKPLGNRRAEDDWIERLSLAVYGSDRDKAAEAVAAALAEGMAPEDVGQAISLAATRLVLCDRGRIAQQQQPNKPVGSVHGDSTGVHASDAANAWRHIARVGDQRTQVASLVTAAFHTAGQLAQQDKEPYPTPASLEKIRTKDPTKLVQHLDEAIRAKDQQQASALVHRYGELQLPAGPVLKLLLGFAVSEDGALHAEKYYRTVSEEFAASRPAFRWRHLTALARVTASEYGYAAPGFSEACKLMKV
jgi:hypothetical protein